MVSKITIFEVHFDDARFGPTLARSDDEETTVESAEEDATSRSPLPGVLALLGVAIAVGVLVRRRRRTDDEQVEIELADGVPAEAAR
ncbi:MAG: hypothetical protein ACOC0X_00580 [Halobacteriota archaeon]